MPSATGKQSPKSMVSGSQAPGRAGIHRKGAFSGATSNNLGGSDYEDEALAGVDDDEDDGDDDDEEGDEGDLEMRPDELIVSENARDTPISQFFPHSTTDILTHMPFSFIRSPCSDNGSNVGESSTVLISMMKNSDNFVATSTPWTKMALVPSEWMSWKTP